MAEEQAGSAERREQGMVKFYKMTTYRHQLYRAGCGLMDFKKPQEYMDVEWPAPPKPPDFTAWDPTGEKALPLGRYRRTAMREIGMSGSLSAIGNEKKREAVRLYRQLSDTFEWSGVRYRRGACLGIGGQGWVVKYDEMDEEGELVRSIVVKRSIDQSSQRALVTERSNMLAFRGKEHLVQTIPMTGEKRGRQDDGAAEEGTPSKRRKVDDDMSSLVIEFAPNGDLGMLISRMRDRGTTVPTQVAWRFLRCLVLACIEMDQPVRLPRSVISASSDDREPHFVHFDLDPTNVLIDDLDEEAPDHDLTPRLKVRRDCESETERRPDPLQISDFGLGHFFHGEEEDFLGDFAFMRHRGKCGFIAPEQWTGEWDSYGPHNVPVFFANLKAGRQCPGNYGSHTNVWGIGLIMECLITRCRPLSPLAPVDLHQLPGRPAGATGSLWSYGTTMTLPIAWHVDDDLRELVCRCLAHYPHQRPKLDELLALCRKAVPHPHPPPRSGSAATAPDRDLARWVTDMLHDAPVQPSAPPTPPPDVEMADW